VVTFSFFCRELKTFHILFMVLDDAHMMYAFPFLIFVFCCEKGNWSVHINCFLLPFIAAWQLSTLLKGGIGNMSISRGDDIIKSLFEDTSSVARLSNVDLSSSQDLFRVCQYIKDGASKGGKTLYSINLCKLDGSKCSHVFEALSDLENEFSLDISYNNLGTMAMSSIAQILAPNVRLLNLTLDGVQMGNSGVARLSTSIVNSRLLCALHLADNGIGKDGMMCLASVIPKMERLVTLNISGNDMSDERSVSSVCSAVKASKVCVLNMSMNKMTDRANQHIAALVNQNRVLESLNIACNPLGDDAMEQIGKSLVDNVVLRSLNLSGTRIGPVGATRLAKCLELNDTLKELDLSRSHHSHISIGVDGALKIADMLTLNRGITTLK
jgi:Ran GTPase-activating protein (RanGAP) involved in mRNA processing and transport